MNERGSGQTKKQMMDAPVGAIFIWCNDNLRYPTSLAKALNRSDLMIERPSFFEMRWMGVKKPVVVDHAAAEYFTPQQRNGWRLWLQHAQATAP